MLLKSASTLCHLLNTLLSFLGHKGSCSLLPPFLHLGKQLYSFVRVAITKWHGWGGLNTRHLFSHSSQGWMFAIKVLAGLVSPEATLLRLKTATLLLCPHVAFCACIPGVSFFFFGLQISSSYKDISQIGLGAALGPHFNLTISVKSPSSNTVTF